MISILILNQLDTFCPQVVVDFAGQGMVAESWESPEQWYNTNIVSKVRLHDQLRLEIGWNVILEFLRLRYMVARKVCFKKLGNIILVPHTLFRTPQ